MMTVSVCLCVCLSASISLEVHGRSLSDNMFLCMLSIVVGRSSSGGVVIRYVLPVFMDDVILAHKPRQLNVAAQLMEAQPICYKRRVGILFAGQWTHTHGPTSNAAVCAY